jgi:hypothetical protein
MKNPLETLLETTPANLAAQQKKALKEHLISVLDHVKKCVEKEQWDKIPVFFSPAGDCMGSDNYCIDFSWSSEKEVGEEKDICYIIQTIKDLTKSIK